MIKLTGGQRIDLLGVRKGTFRRCGATWGCHQGYAYGKSFRTVKTCVGSDFCRYGVGDSTALGIALEERATRAWPPAGEDDSSRSPGAPATAPRHCARTLVSSRSTAAAGRFYVGGAAAHIRRAIWPRSDSHGRR